MSVFGKKKFFGSSFLKKSNKTLHVLQKNDRSIPREGRLSLFYLLCFNYFIL